MIPNINTQEKLNSPMRYVLFFREIEGELHFYPLVIPEATIEDNVKCNPGTIRVEDALTGEVLWEQKGGKG